MTNSVTNNIVWLVASDSHLSSKSSFVEGSLLLKSAISKLGINETDVREILYKSNYLRLVSGIIRNPAIFAKDVLFSKGNFDEFKFKVHEHEIEYWREKIFAEKPSLIIGIGLTKSLNITAREAGIITIEVQHGILTQKTIDSYWKFKYNGNFFPPNIIFGWDEYFRKIVELNGITFEKLEYLEKRKFNNDNSNEYDYLYCLNYRAYGFLKIITIPKRMRSHLRHNRSKTNLMRLHPLTYGPVNKTITRMLLIWVGAFMPLSKNVSFLEILGDAKEIVTEPSAAIWEAYYGGKEINVIGNLNREQFSNDIINHCNII